MVAWWNAPRPQPRPFLGHWNDYNGVARRWLQICAGLLQMLSASALRAHLRQAPLLPRACVARLRVLPPLIPPPAIADVETIERRNPDSSLRLSLDLLPLLLHYIGLLFRSERRTESRRGRYAALQRAASHFRKRVMLLRASVYLRCLRSLRYLRYFRYLRRDPQHKAPAQSAPLRIPTMRRAAVPSAGRRLRYPIVPPHASSAPPRFDAHLRRQTPLLTPSMCRTPSCALCVPRTCTSDTAAYPSTCRALACVHWPAATWHQRLASGHVSNFPPRPPLRFSPLLRTDVREVATRSPGARLKKGGIAKKSLLDPGVPR